MTLPPFLLEGFGSAPHHGALHQIERAMPRTALSVCDGFAHDIDKATPVSGCSACHTLDSRRGRRGLLAPGQGSAWNRILPDCGSLTRFGTDWEGHSHGA
jgi:hypothetical protein